MSSMRREALWRSATIAFGWAMELEETKQMKMNEMMITTRTTSYPQYQLNNTQKSFGSSLKAHLDLLQNSLTLHAQPQLKAIDQFTTNIFSGNSIYVVVGF